MPTVFVVDDDRSMRESLKELFESVDHEVQTFASATEFLENHNNHKVGCLVLDIRMPGMTGLHLLQELRRQGVEIPTLVVTAYGDVPTAVEAMKAGAIEFLEKPFSPTLLLNRVEQAIELSQASHRKAGVRVEMQQRLTRLSSREREVFDLLLSGMPNKAIAHELGISEKTVSAHRAAILEKMGYSSMVELSQVLTDVGIIPSRLTPTENAG